MQTKLTSWFFTRTMPLRCCLAGVLCLLWAGMGAPLEAREAYLLSDAETENFLTQQLNPLLEAAGLEANSIKVVLVKDDSANAFVSLGPYIFIHTGLLRTARSPNQIAGVLAHELGHIMAGHVLRFDDAASQSTGQLLAPLLLGAAAIALGGPAAGIGVFAAGQSMNRLELMKYSRGQESAADLLALKYLQESGKSAKGLLEFFKILYNENIALLRNIPPYLATHPRVPHRIAVLEKKASTSPFFQKKDTAESIIHLALIQAKLSGHFDRPARSLRLYPPSNTSLPAFYARASAYMRKGDTTKALVAIDKLITKEPANPYFRELKGQIFFEHGDPIRAIKPLQEAHELKPDSGEISLLLARALISAKQPGNDDEAMRLLKHILEKDKENGMAWFTLAQLYEARNQRHMAMYATAELRYIGGDYAAAHRFCTLAADSLQSQEKPAAQRCRDILLVAEKELRERRKAYRRSRR